MVTTVISATANVILVIVSVIIYVLIAACLLPKVFLKPKYNASAIKDRGLGRFIFSEGRAIVYQPSLHVKKYVEKYILSSVDGEKYIKCKLDPRVFSLKYDAVAFDANDKMISTVRIEEKIKTRGYSRSALLPVNTAYVSVIVKEVNGVCADTGDKLIISVVRALAFFVSELIIHVFAGLLITNLVAEILTTALSVRYADVQFGFALVTSMLAGAVLSLIIFALHLSKDTKIGK